MDGYIDISTLDPLYITAANIDITSKDTPEGDGDVIKILNSGNNGKIILGNNIYLGEDENWNVSNNVDTLDFNYSGTSILTLNDNGQVDCKSITISDESNDAIYTSITSTGIIIDNDGVEITTITPYGIAIGGNQGIYFNHSSGTSDEKIDSVLSNFEYVTDIDNNIVWDGSFDSLTSESKVVSEIALKNIVEPLIARIKELESASGSSTDPVDQIKLKINGTNEYCIVKAEKDETGAITLSLE